MKTASRILLLIGAILSCVEIFVYCIMGFIFIGMGSSPEVKEDLIKEYNPVNNPGGVTPEEYAKAIQSFFVALGVVFVIAAILCIINAIIAFVGRSKGNKPLMILNIIFGFLSSCIINAVGGIFGLIAKDNNTETASLNE